MTEIFPATELHGEIVAAIHEASVPAPWSAKTFSNMLNKPNVLALLGADAGVPVGFVIAQSAGDEAEILNIATMPGARRMGLGTALLVSVTKQLKQHGTKALFLEVAEDNHAARQLYEDAGFVQVGRREGYYPGEGCAVDALLLRLSLVET